MSLLARILISAVRLYQIALSPYWGSQCRFTPTCSHYAIGAIRKHGAIKGGIFSTRRLFRCHPWCEGGYDPVP